MYTANNFIAPFLSTSKTVRLLYPNGKISFTLIVCNYQKSSVSGNFLNIILEDATKEYKLEFVSHSEAKSAFISLKQAIDNLSPNCSGIVGGPVSPSGRFGIEDNYGVQTRSIDMQDYLLEVFDVSTVSFRTKNSNPLINPNFFINSEEVKLENLNLEIGDGLLLGEKDVNGKPFIKFSLLNGSVTFRPADLNHGAFDIIIPNYASNNVTLPLSVNGFKADASGNIILPENGNSDWNSTGGAGFILNKPNLAVVAFTGSYNDLINLPTIPTRITIRALFAVSNVGTGNATYDNLTGVINIPSPIPQANSDWNSTTGPSFILNKPIIPSTANFATVTYVNNQTALKADKTTTLTINGITQDLSQNRIFTIDAGWSLTGNTLNGTEKFGSINNQPLKFYTNNINTMTLDTNGTLFSGKTLINTITDTGEQLQINGKVKISDGTEGLGNVWTSNETGVGSWTVPVLAPIPSLQNVTDVGNSTTQNISVSGIGKRIGIQLDNLYSIFLGSEQVRSSRKLFIEFNQNIGSTKLQATATDQLLNYYLPTRPSGSYTLSTSVNGIFADSTGNITIPTGGAYIPLAGTEPFKLITGPLETTGKSYGNNTGNLWGLVGYASPGVDKYLMNGIGVNSDYRANEVGAFSRYSANMGGSNSSSINNYATTLAGQSAKMEVGAYEGGEEAISYMETSSGAYTSRFALQISTSAGIASTVGATLSDDAPTARGLRGMQDFTANIQSLDYVQKKYVDNLFASVGTTISLTTTGISGAATLVGTTLNIPNYAANSWNLAGNNATDPTINFIGTTDLQDFVVRVNNISIAKFGGISKNSFAFGDNSIADGPASFAFGSGNLAKETNSFAGGFNNIANGFSIALGSVNKALEGSSVAIGNSNTTYQNSIAFGSDNTVGHTFQSTGGSSYGPIAIGKGNIVTSDYSYAFGIFNNIGSIRSFCIGDSNTVAAGGFAAIIIGRSNSSTNGYTLGEQNVATTGGISLGYSQTRSSISFLMGQGLTGRSYGGAVVGSYNDNTETITTSYSDTGRAFQVGTGNRIFNPNNFQFVITRKNAITVLNNGNTGFNTILPTEKLHIVGNGRMDSLILNTPSVNFDATQPGTIWADAMFGLVLRGIGGTLNDFTIYSPSGSSVLRVKTGSSNAIFGYNVQIDTLASGSIAPTTTGVTKMVITDQNGLLSFLPIPTGGGGTGTTYTGTNPIIVSGSVISINDATSTTSGAITSGIQSIGGDKTFIGNITAANLSGTNTGDNATNSQYSGLISNATHTGDATGATFLTLATVNTNIGTFGSTSSVNTITVNGKGLITALLNNPIQITESQVTNLVNDLLAKQATLVSGVNIKTINGNSLLGSGDIVISVGTGGGGGIVNTIGITPANGVSGISSTGADPRLTITLSAITPSSIVATGNITGSNLSGTNTGDNATNSQYSSLITNATHTGDATGSGFLTLATVNTNIGTFTNANVTVNAKGLVTAVSNGVGGAGGGTTYTGTAPVVVSGSVISVSDATASLSGLLTSGQQVIGGPKTFIALTTHSNEGIFNVTIPGLSTYGIHFNNQVTSDYATGITWNGAGPNNTQAQAGVYVQGSLNYGTKMYFATTNNYTIGAITAMIIDHLGNVNITKGALLQVGNQVLHAGNFNSYSPTLTGIGATGNWGINVTGTSTTITGTVTESQVINLISDLNSKQATLISGINIKTVNGNSLLGSGDIVISAGGGGGIVNTIGITSANGVSGTSTTGSDPRLTITLGAITPSSIIASGAISGSNLSGTNTGDNATNSQYSGLVSNATHTGDATGATVLTLATVNANVGVFGTSIVIPTFSVNGKGLITSVVALAIPSSSSTTIGLLTSIDWNTFNNKQPAGNYLIANQPITITANGDASGTSTASSTNPSIVLNLATVNANVGTFTNANVTVNSKGLITAISNGSAGGGGIVNTIGVTTLNGVSATSSGGTDPRLTITLGAITPSSIIASGSISGSNLSGTNTGDNATNSQYSGLISNVTHTGDATGSTVLTLATVNANVGTFGTSITIPSFVVNAKGLITSVSTLAIPISSSTTTGLLTSIDWNTFNSKQPAGNYLTTNQPITITATGDATGTSTASSISPSIVLNLATVNANVGTFTNANVTVNAKGLVTAISSGTGGGSGVTTLAPIGFASNGNGATISGSTLTLQFASASFGGLISSQAQIIGGDKTFNAFFNLPLLATNITPPVTTGSTKMVIVDGNGRLSNAPLPTSSTTQTYLITTIDSSAALVTTITLGFATQNKVEIEVVAVSADSLGGYSVKEISTYLVDSNGNIYGTATRGLEAPEQLGSFATPPQGVNHSTSLLGRDLRIYANGGLGGTVYWKFNVRLVKIGIVTV